MPTCNWLDLETLARISTDYVEKYPWTLLCGQALVAMDSWCLCTLIHWEHIELFIYIYIYELTVKVVLETPTNIDYLNQ
jgi:hypothetical protein